jgi:hypothetical protein
MPARLTPTRSLPPLRVPFRFQGDEPLPAELRVEVVSQPAPIARPAQHARRARWAWANSAIETRGAGPTTLQRILASPWCKPLPVTVYCLNGALGSMGVAGSCAAGWAAYEYKSSTVFGATFVCLTGVTASMLVSVSGCVWGHALAKKIEQARNVAAHNRDQI